MLVKNLHIKKFRHMNNINVEFSNYLTAISGPNSTGKSTILGLVGQIFVFNKKYKTINKSSFETKYSEIFKFCPIHDYKSKYDYSVTINDGITDIKKEAKTRLAERKKDRYRIDIGERGSAEKGAIDFPVIYLGLKRLFPLAQERDGSITVNILDLSTKDKNFYSKQVQDILVLLDPSIKPQNIKSPNKQFLALETSKYSNLGNSAGQDNLGQILTAILSFRKLKETLGDAYKGGILLIDEVDATLYAGSQINLIRKLFKFSNDLNLQIIFTTHSLEILRVLKNKPDWGSVINFFEINNNDVKNTINPPIEKIINNILTQSSNQKEIEKIHVLCEDKKTKAWCNNLLNRTSIKKLVSINEVPISASVLIALSKKNHKIFKKILYVVDGDQREKVEGLERVICLPGDFYPEKIFYKFLYNLDDDNDFWENDSYFNKHVCFNQFTDNRYKDWFKAKCATKHNPLPKMLNVWRKENPVLVKDFQKEFSEKLDKLIST